MEYLYRTQTCFSYAEYKRYTWAVSLNRRAWLKFAILELIIFALAGLIQSMFLLIFAVVYPAVTVLLQNMRIKKVYRSNKLLQDRTITFEFYDAYLIERTDLGSTKVAYDTLHEIIETKTNVYLMIAENQGYILTKAAFPEGLGAFLSQLRKRMEASGKK